MCTLAFTCIAARPQGMGAGDGEGQGRSEDEGAHEYMCMSRCVSPVGLRAYPQSVTPWSALSAEVTREAIARVPDSPNFPRPTLANEFEIGGCGPSGATDASMPPNAMPCAAASCEADAEDRRVRWAS